MTSIMPYKDKASLHDLNLVINCQHNQGWRHRGGRGGGAVAPPPPPPPLLTGPNIGIIIVCAV